jgi:hypothetical protein
MISSIKSDVEIIGVDDPYLKLLGLYPSSSKKCFSSNINKTLFILRLALLLASNALRLFFFNFTLFVCLLPLSCSFRY